jgi:hypothetical protein
LSGKVRPPGPLLRLARLIAGHSDVRRSSDRSEGAVLLLLLAGFLASIVGASLLGAHVYRAEHANAAGLRPVEAVLARNGPAGSLSGFGQVRASWRQPGGGRRAGLLTTVTAPGIWGAPAGTRIQIWVTSSGTPVPPPSEMVMVFSAVLIELGVISGSGVALLVCYGLCRLGLDRRRLRDWESAWAATGPRWTSRR